ncbi:MAG: DUF2971 domain-containing protein [Gammaproteobacteria bacterium]|nr:DUF2971 domain-containing protein [Gammaproteobacteria bacterium]
MYHDHPQLSPPPDDAVLWRYMDFTKFVSLLEKSALFFCRPDQLGDPFEGSISPATPPLLAGELKVGSRITQGNIDFRQFVRMARVNCWHMGEFESEAMWRLYTRERDGVAIKTVFARFKEALVGEASVNVSRVWYRDYRTERIPFGNALLPLVHKRISFQHEQEVRAIYLRIPAEDGQEDADVGYCEVDLPGLVEEIVVAPFAKDWFVDLVRSLAERYGIGDRVRPSTLSDAPTFTLPVLIPETEKPRS